MLSDFEQGEKERDKTAADQDAEPHGFAYTPPTPEAPAATEAPAQALKQEEEKKQIQEAADKPIFNGNTDQDQDQQASVFDYMDIIKQNANKL